MPGKHLAQCLAGSRPLIKSGPISSTERQPRPGPGPLGPQSAHYKHRIVGRVCGARPGNRAGEGASHRPGVSHHRLLFLPSPAKLLPSLLPIPALGPRDAGSKGPQSTIFSAVSVSRTFKPLDFRDQGRRPALEQEPAHLAASSLFRALPASLSEHPSAWNASPARAIPTSELSPCPSQLMLPAHSTHGPRL